MDTAHTIQIRIAELRERMRCTLDRSKQPAIRAQIMEELAKLKALSGIVEEEDARRTDAKAVEPPPHR